MRLLVLGGTVFLSRAVAAEAGRRGHDVVCACRGASGPVPDGVRLVRWDRGAGEPAPGDGIGTVDAVVDVARRPSWVRAALSAWSDAHWVFVSSISVYSDDATPGGRPDLTPTHAAVHDDVAIGEQPELYGALKVGCEVAVQTTAASSTVIRPGLLSGPGDVTSRFGYWPERLDEGGEVLAGGSPDDTVQIIDVDDLAAWIVTIAEQRTSGTFDAVGPSQPFGDLLAQVAAGVGADADLMWVPSEFLIQHAVEPWAGPDSLPLWLPRPDYDGMLARDATPAQAAGLVVRPVADTARATLAWLREHPGATRTGMSRQREREVLAAWHADPRSG